VKKNKLDGMFDLDLRCRQMAEMARGFIEEEDNEIVRIVCGAEVFFALSLFARDGKFDGFPLALDRRLNDYRMIIERER